MFRITVSNYINNFINHTFRDVADQDYVLARIAFRERLDLQFLWLSQQALEKYLKAILLYNRRPAKNFGHALRSVYDAVVAIDDLPFSFPPSVLEFLVYLDGSASRYFEFPYEVGTKRLMELDEAVWHVRRWCAPIRGNLEIGEGQHAKLIRMLPFEIAKRQNPYYFRHRQKFALHGGFLEDVIQKRRSEHLRAHLLWNNTYFSHRRKTSFGTQRWASGWPPIDLHPDLLSELEPLVHFSKEFRKRIAEEKKRRRSPVG